MVDMKEPIRIAFICTGNSCRSQMAEAIMRQAGGTRFQVASAGSHPAGFIHPIAIETLAALGLSVQGQYSKSWTEIAKTPQDIIITVCDNAAGTACPRWKGQPVSAHWSLPDPSFHSGTDDERLAMAHSVAEALRKRAEALASLPLEQLAHEEIKQELQKLSEVW